MSINLDREYQSPEGNEIQRNDDMIQRIGMFLLSVVVGYFTMFFLILASQEGLFGTVSFYNTPLPQLTVSGLLTSASAVVGGIVAASIFGKPHFPPVIAIGMLVVAESTFMISAGRLEGPVWFDIMAAGSLLVGLALGFYLRRSLDVLIRGRDKIAVT